jgi:iron complex transport system permease protein
MSVLIICGVMVGYICSAITEIVVTFADDSNIVNLHNWSLGTFSGSTWSDVASAGSVVALAVTAAFLLSKPIGAYQLGESAAGSLGVNVLRLRIAVILLSSVLSAVVTAFAGPVSFVGVAVPHLIRNLMKTQRPIVMIPACFLGGAVFCLFSDLIARTLFAPTELSISTVTAVFGAPCVIWIMMTRNKRPI